MKSYHNYQKPSHKVSCNWHRKLSTADKHDKAIARGVSETATNKHKDILNKYSITTLGNGWLVCMRATSENDIDAPIIQCDTLNDAIQYAHDFDYAYNLNDLHV